MSHNDDNVHSFSAAQGKKDGKESRKDSFFRRARAAADFVREPSEPLLNLSPVVRTLCLVLLGITVALHMVGNRTLWDLMMTFGFVPGRYTGVITVGLPTFLSPVTHMFLHAGWLHLFVNVGMLMAFGTVLERVMGVRRFLLLCLASGIAGAFTHVLFYPDAVTPMIGASGAISGLFAGVLMLMHKQGMMGEGGYRRLLPAAAVWVVISLFFGFFGIPGASGAVAWTAHIGGFFAGFFIFHGLMRRRDF